MIDIKQVQLRKECDIISKWDNKDEIKVSVLCATYNHESYIESAIVGFLMQNTTFAFEVIIHDDASTDNTINIIKKYQKAYPSIIKSILQKENQYSKGGFKPTAYLSKFVKGQYAALCEGDDYWIFKDKLQSQYIALEKNKEINLCIHGAFTVDQSNGALEDRFPKRLDREYVIPFEEVFTTTGQFSPTASMLIRHNIIENLPKFFFDAPIGDFFLEVLAGRNGIYYIPAKMSVYRSNAIGSWSNLVLANIHKKIDMYQLYLRSLNDLEAYLCAEEKSLVRYKKQIIFYSLALSYLSKSRRLLAIKYFFYSIKGKARLKYNFLFLLEFIGLNRDVRNKIKRISYLN